MLTTRRYEYLHLRAIRLHPEILNRRIDPQKVEHYRSDILNHGLLEPLVVWEKNRGEYYLVGGFHRYEAIKKIREERPDYFEQVDVRVVAADLDEIRALNLKLNADRVDVRITDFFETIVHLNNANWSKSRIAEFLDRSISWVEDIIRYVPSMPAELRTRMEEGRLSWERAKRICRAIREAEAGSERQVLERELERLDGPTAPVRRPLTVSKAKRRLVKHVRRNPNTMFAISGEQLLSLLVLLEGKEADEQHLDAVRRSFPGLLEEGNEAAAREAAV